MLKIAKYLYRFSRGFVLAFKIFTKKKGAIHRHTKSIYFDISNNPFERYFYLFVKFFLIHDYNVYIKTNFKFLGDFDTYSMLLFEEKNVKFCFMRPQNCELFFSDKHGRGILLSYDYFSGNKKDLDFSVPMAMHPQIYYFDYFLEDVKKTKRLNSLFFAGNFDENQYSIIKESKIFNVCSRIELYNSLKQNLQTIIPESMKDLNAIISPKKIIIVDRKFFSVPMQMLRETLGNYCFFLACPGISMPFSHNIIEAMSVGTIPLIQSHYASLFNPPLLHLEHAIIFENTEDLYYKISFAFSLSEDVKMILSNKVLEYYNNYLTPDSVVENIVRLKPEKIYINAEAHSVRLIKDVH